MYGPINDMNCQASDRGWSDITDMINTVLTIILPIFTIIGPIFLALASNILPGRNYKKHRQRKGY